MRNFSLLIGGDLSKISSRIGNVRSVTRRIWCNLSNQAVDSRWTGLWKKLNPISNVVGLFPLDENILYEVYIHILTLGISSERMFTVTCSLAPCPKALEIKKLWGRWVGGKVGWGGGGMRGSTREITLTSSFLFVCNLRPFVNDFS